MNKATNRTEDNFKSIGELTKPFEKLQPPAPVEVIVGNEDGEPRCRFDMFVRWPATSARKKKTFTYRADYNPETGRKDIHDPAKMLWSLIRILKNHHSEYLLCEIYDNTKPKDSIERVILRYKQGKVFPNRLSEYSEMLKDHPLPEWLK